ncbi:MAG: hypothetical protein M3P33_02615 [bacterium]|nr:hypothetical protein [bacterium]
MSLKLNEKISILSLFNKDTNQVLPYIIKWQNKKYTITKVGLHHTTYQGTTLHHIFSVTDGQIFFRLNLDTSNLHWTLEEIYDPSTH